MKVTVEKVDKILGKDMRQVHPMTIYSTDEIYFGQFTQKIFTRTPKMAKLQIIAKRIIPTVPFKPIRQIGVYVPAIRMLIIMWSNFFKRVFIFSDMSNE